MLLYCHSVSEKSTQSIIDRLHYSDWNEPIVPLSERGPTFSGSGKAESVSFSLLWVRMFWIFFPGITVWILCFRTQMNSSYLQGPIRQEEDLNWLSLPSEAPAWLVRNWYTDKTGLMLNMTWKYKLKYCIVQTKYKYIDVLVFSVQLIYIFSCWERQLWSEDYIKEEWLHCIHL